jgi:hypothetical protein
VWGNEELALNISRYLDPERESVGRDLCVFVSWTETEESQAADSYKGCLVLHSVRSGCMNASVTACGCHLLVIPCFPSPIELKPGYVTLNILLISYGTQFKDKGKIFPLF